MGNTQTHAHTARRHTKHTKHNHYAFTEKKHHQRARHHSRRHTRKQHGGFWPFKSSDAPVAAAAAAPSAGDECASCPAKCRMGLPSVSGLTSSLKEGLGKGNDALLGLNDKVSAKVSGTVDGLKAKGAGFTGAVSGLFGSAEAPVVAAPAEPNAQAGGRRRKGRKTNRRRKHKKH